MNLTYLIGVIVAFVVMILGMVQGSGGFSLDFTQMVWYLDVSSVFIVIGCTICVVLASFPMSMLSAIPKHFAILLNTKKYNPLTYIDQLVELAQVARKNGLLALEEMANQQTDLFFKQAIMLIVDANDPDKVRSILNNDIEITSARHEGVAGMYDKASAMAPAFGMVGTLIGLIKMLNNMTADAGGSSAIGPAMGVALITTLYGCILAQIIFNPIASNLRTRDEAEVLCRMIIVDGIMSIQSGENPKFLKEKLLTFTAQKQRDAALGVESASDKKDKKGKKGKKG
jgi:chemotaxis protein MotA